MRTLPFRKFRVDVTAADRVNTHVGYTWLAEVGPDLSHYPHYSPSEVFFAATTAARSWKGLIQVSERRVDQRAPTWNYHINWPSPFDGGKWRALHTIDIPMDFDNVAPSRYPRDAPGAQAVADAMSDALLAFARTGDPGTAARPWPRFELSKRPTVILDVPSRLENDPRGAERQLFERAVYIQPGT